MLTLGTELSPYRHHETVFVRAGAGQHQHVPWPRIGYGDDPSGLGDQAVFGSLGGLTDDEKQKLAERIRTTRSVSDAQAILEIIPTIAERQEVAARAVAIGADTFVVRAAMAELEQGVERKKLFTPPPMPYRIIWGVLSTASFAASVYHGVKRNHGSIGWGLWWGLMGALFPVVTPVIAFAMPPGFAKPKNGLGRPYRRRNRKSRRS